MKWLKRFLFVLFAAGVIAVFVYAFRPQPVAVEFAQPVRGPMQVTIDEEGETRLRKRFTLSAPVAGRVSRIDLEPGDRVVAGRTTIATLSAIQPSLLDERTRTEAEARVSAAETAVGRARANRMRAQEELAFAQSQLERYTALLKDGLVPKERRDLSEAEVRTKREALNAAEFGAKEAESNVEVARATLLGSSQDTADAGAGGPITVRSPVDGVILRRLRESEGIVPAGEPLVEIGDTSRIEIVSDLLSADAVRIQSGSRVLIQRWGGIGALEGRVRRVEPSGFTKLSALGVEEQRVNVIIDFNDPASARQLGDGYRVEVRVVTWETAHALKIPTSSLFKTGDNWTVFRIVGDRAVLCQVEIGQRNSVEAEVLAGLSESDKIIVHPSDEVTDGVQITAR
jgi:HlyD family secretion protein